MPKWKRQPEERPSQILNAALDVFAASGYRAATMQDVANAAGITKGTIYLYFRSKRELFIAVVKSELERMLALQPSAGFFAELDPLGAARQLGGAFLEALMSRRVTQIIPLVISELNNVPDIRDMYRTEIVPRVTLPLASLLDQGMKQGIFKRLDPVITARCLMGMFFVFALTQEVLGGKDITPMSRDDIVETIVTIFFRGLLNEGTG